MNYEDSWKKLEQTIEKELVKARHQDELDEYNGLPGGHADWYEDMKDLMEDCKM